MLLGAILLVGLMDTPDCGRATMSDCKDPSFASRCWSAWMKKCYEGQNDEELYLGGAVKNLFALQRTINNAQMIDIMAEKADLTKSEAKSTLDSFTGGVTETLKQGDQTKIFGLGAFATDRREARRARNPNTGKYIDIPAHTLVKFKVDKAFEEYVNKDEEKHKMNIVKKSKGRARCLVNYPAKTVLSPTIENKKEMIEAMAENANISKDSACRALDTFIETLAETLKNGGRVLLPDFGTFLTSFRRESETRDPTTGEKIIIPAHRKPKFKPSKILNELVNKYNNT